MHIPVLKKEVLHFLNPKKNENFVDCTAGGGGHTRAVLEKNKPSGKVLAIEWDADLYRALKEEGLERVVLANESYTRLKDIVRGKDFFPVNGVLFDLGFSSFHVEKSGRGFSFMRDEPLDMRYNKDNPLTAGEIVNNYKKKDIVYILKKWGGERYAEEIAAKIESFREKKPIESTLELVGIVEKAVPGTYKRKKKIHCATKTFQALRIAVNGELLGLESAIKQALEVVEKGGRIVVICFHEGEEEIIRKFLRLPDISVLTHRPIRPSKEEVSRNIRSRSAKLYAAVKN